MINATIFNPTDNNLEAKVKSVRDVQKAYHGVKASLKISKANGYNSALGTEEELKEALEISQNSYNQAIKSLSEGELKKASFKNYLLKNIKPRFKLFEANKRTNLILKIILTKNSCLLG